MLNKVNTELFCFFPRLKLFKQDDLIDFPFLRENTSHSKTEKTTAAGLQTVTQKLAEKLHSIALMTILTL